MTAAEDFDSGFGRLAWWLDAEARRFACGALGHDDASTPAEQVETIHQGVDGDAERLLDMLRTEDLVPCLRYWRFMWDERRGSTCVTDLDISAERMTRLHVIADSDDGGRMRLPVPAEMPLVRAAALPHFSLIRCRAVGDERVAMSGPAVLTSDGWMFAVHTAWSGMEFDTRHGEMDEALTIAKLLPLGDEFRLDARRRFEALAGAVAEGGPRSTATRGSPP